MKTIIVTAGGTIEPIDGVRGITNFSSGTLGILIAETLSPEFRVILLRGKKAPHATPHENLTELEITDTQSLVDALQRQRAVAVDGFIHAMAVSDYTVDQVTDIHTVLEQLSFLPQITLADVAAAFQQPAGRSGKISSVIETPLLVLKQTPKVIQRIRSLWPNITLVGFKLLNGVADEELIRVAQASLHKSHADYVLANDLTQISKTSHRALLIDAQGRITPAATKSDIARLMLEVFRTGSSV